MLGKATGTLRFELTGAGRTERWLVTIGKDGVAVSRKNGRADCVVRADKHLFDGLATRRCSYCARCSASSRSATTS